MYKTVAYEQLAQKKWNKSFVLVDVRTKKEYEEAHIPGAVLFPIMNELQREEIGTLYKNGDIREAKRQGIQYGAEKLMDYEAFIAPYAERGEAVIFYCSRGGFRSSSIVSFFSSLSYPVFKLDHGYKGYRAFIRADLPRVIELYSYVTLYGNTGCGKTEILQKMASMKDAVIDLEGLAHHKGSLLGSVGEGKQPSQKQFESELYEAFLALAKGPVFLEGESKRIGSVFIPDALFHAMKNSLKIQVSAPMDQRVHRIREEYVLENDDELKMALKKLGRYLSNETVDDYLEKVGQKDYDPVIRDLIDRYYDPKYQHHKKEYHAEIVHDKSLETTIRRIHDVVDPTVGIVDR